MRIRELLGLFSSEHVRAKDKADSKFGSVWINQFKDHVGRATGITSLAVTTNNSGGLRSHRGETRTTPSFRVLKTDQKTSSAPLRPQRPRASEELPRVAACVKWIIYEGEDSSSFDLSREWFTCNKFCTWERSKNCLRACWR